MSAMIERRAFVATALAACSAPALAARAAPPDRAIAAAERRRRARIAAVRSWGYQLRRIVPAEIAASPFDLVVVDHAIAARQRFHRQWTPEEIAQMALRPDGARRIVLAYLSIGEAERYRFYWPEAWHDDAQRPAWIGTVNPKWAGNYAVHYWAPAWRQVMLGRPDAYLERILAQGFDGIYLDRADAFADWAGARPAARREMVALVAAIARHARHLKPDALVVMQNAEELIAEPNVAAAIDAVAKEDLVYGIDHAEGRNGADEIAWSLRHLRSARARGRAVLAVEYLTDPAKAAEAQRIAARERIVLTFALRGLHTLTIGPPRDGDGPRPSHFPATPPPPPAEALRN